MNGMKPEFLQGAELPRNYYEKQNPYVSAPSCNVNLLELSRYAQKNRKRLSDLTKEEVRRFSKQD